MDPILLINLLYVFIFFIFAYILLFRRDRTYADFMMTVLSISYLISDLLIVLRGFSFFSQTELETMIYYCLTSFLSTFAPFWLACFAIFTYRVMKATGEFHFKRFIYVSFFISLSCACITPYIILTKKLGLTMKLIEGYYILTFQNADSASILIYFFVNVVLLSMCPAIVASYAYYKVFNFFSEAQKMYSTQISPVKTFLYLIVTIVCLTPKLIYVFYKFIGFQGPGFSICEFLGLVLQDAWVIMTVSFFLFLKPVNNGKESLIGLPMTESTEYFERERTKESLLG